jgi:hypothetical protein
MRRRVLWKYSDSSPIYGNLIASVQGDGELKILVGFPVSSATVAFSRIYDVDHTPHYGYPHGNEPEVYVTSVDDDGFTVAYKNIPDTLDVNYFAM